MSPDASSPDQDLVTRIAGTSGVSPAVARRIVEDVLAHHAESLADFVARRHRELVGLGWKNAAIYERIGSEIRGRVFKGPDCTTRQIRRMIYG